MQAISTEYGSLYSAMLVVDIIGTWLFGCGINLAIAIKADLPNKKLAWIPGVQYWLSGQAVRFNSATCVMLMLPFFASVLQAVGVTSYVTTPLNLMGAITMLIALIRLFRCFGKNPANLWWLLLPIVGWIILIVKVFSMIFSKKVPFIDYYDHTVRREERAVHSPDDSWKILNQALALSLTGIIVGIVAGAVVSGIGMQMGFKQAELKYAAQSSSSFSTNA